MTDRTSEADAIAKLAMRAIEPGIIISPDGRTFLISGAEAKVREISDPHDLIAARPDHIKQAVIIQTVDSLVDYVDRFKDEGTMLFADVERDAIEARLDYHKPKSTDHDDHYSRMVLPFSVEWATWATADRKLVGQLEFARFLEENGGDIVAPEAATVLEACRDLQAVRTADFKKAVRTSSDNEDFEFSDSTTLKSQKVEVPTKFKLMIPVYFGEQPTEVFAFLRWKLDGRNLLLGIALHRAEHVRQAVFKQIVLDVAERTACPAVFGRLGA
jgi:uncharacterized protein YfdQ (DUF2303 family)